MGRRSLPKLTAPDVAVAPGCASVFKGTDLLGGWSVEEKPPGVPAGVGLIAGVEFGVAELPWPVPGACPPPQAAENTIATERTRNQMIRRVLSLGITQERLSWRSLGVKGDSRDVPTSL